jgi:hypothetical protein
MAKQLAALLGGGLDLKALAEMLRRQGRGQDTILAHITPQEAALLKSRGGAGTMNPATGLPEFQQDDYGDDYSGVDLGVYSQPVSQPSIQSSDIMPTPETGGEPVTPTYGTVAQRFEAPVEVPSYAQDLFPPVPSPSFTPQLPQMPNEFVGPQQVRDFKQEAIDQGAAPGRSFEDMLKTGAKQVLGTREGLAGLGTAAALFQARQAGQQARRMQQELSQIGAPNRALGQEMIARGQRGELTPVQMQQMAALDARQKQQLAQRGLTSGTAQQQQQARMQEMQQRGAQDLIDQGIKIAGIGDQYQAAAVRAGYAADQATRDMLNTTLTNLYRTIYGNVATPETTSKTPPPRG